MSIVLGDGPDRLTVKMSGFGDFVAALVYDDLDPDTPNEWPAGVDIELRFYPTETTTTAAATWPADITGDRAQWDKDKDDVAADVLTPGNEWVRLFYIDAGAELEWASGKVKDVG